MICLQTIFRQLLKTSWVNPRCVGLVGALYAIVPVGGGGGGGERRTCSCVSKGCFFFWLYTTPPL